MTNMNEIEQKKIDDVNRITLRANDFIRHPIMTNAYALGRMIATITMIIETLEVVGEMPRETASILRSRLAKVGEEIYHKCVECDKIK
jgi:hypothetical protein